MRDQLEVSHSGLEGDSPTEDDIEAAERGGRRMTNAPCVGFARANAAVLANLSAICARLLPGGKCQGNKWVAKEFATPNGAAGSSPVSLIGYIEGCPPREAALHLSHMLNFDEDGGETGCSLDMTCDNGLVSADARGRTTARLAAAPGRFCVVHLGAMPSSPRFEIN